MTSVRATSAIAQRKPAFKAAPSELKISEEARPPAPDWPRRRFGVPSTSHSTCHARAAGRIRAALPTRRQRVREGRVRHTICTTLMHSIGFGGIPTARCQRAASTERPRESEHGESLSS